MKQTHWWIELKLVKNSNWWEADQLAIYLAGYKTRIHSVVGGRIWTRDLRISSARITGYAAFTTSLRKQPPFFSPNLALSLALAVVGTREKRTSERNEGEPFLVLVFPRFFSSSPSFFARAQLPKAWDWILHWGSGWGLVLSAIWPFFSMFSVKFCKILMLSVLKKLTVKC